MDRQRRRVGIALRAALVALPVGAAAKEYHRPVTPRTDRFEDVGPKVRLACGVVAMVAPCRQEYAAEESIDTRRWIGKR